MKDLITVPTFTFPQGSIFKGDADYESPITVLYYNGLIELKQEGDFDIEETVRIHPKFLNKLFVAIKKHLPEAESTLKEMYK